MFTDLDSADSSYSTLILSALCESPLLVGDCPEAGAFDRLGLGVPSWLPELSLNQKLGHLYEEGLAYLLEDSECYDLLEQSLQLQSDRHHTLGELDFLLRDHSSGELIHLELAVKFYLAVESPDGLLLPGPDARDNYFKKLDRLRTHQLTLPQRYPEHLPAAYRNKPISTRHLIIGCLFDYLNADSPAEAEFLHPKARRGKWIHQGELSSVFPNDCRPEIIPKHLWPVELSALEQISLEPLDLSIPLTRCVMVRIKGEEVPLFIAPNGYPEMS